MAQSTGRFGTMLALFVVALLVVTPYAVIRIRQVLADRAARRPPVEGAAADRPEERPHDDLARVVEAIAAGARTAEPFEVRVPATPVHEGRPVPAEVVQGVLADALRRSRVVVSERRPGADGEWWTCLGRR